MTTSAAGAALERLVRAALGAGVTGVASTDLIAAAAQLVAPGHRLFVGIDHTFASVRVQGQVADAEVFAGFFDGRYPAHAAARDALYHRPQRARSVELTATGDRPLACAVVALGSCPIADDRARAAAALGIEAAAIDGLPDQPCDAFELATDGNAATVTLRFTADGDAGAALLDRLARARGATPPQLRFMAQVHPELAAGRPVSLAVTVTAGGVAPGLGAEYPAPTWEQTVKLFQGFWPRADAGRKLGTLAGVLASEVPAMLRISLGPEEPPGVAVWAEAG